LIAHGNYLADDEIDFLAATPSIATAFCPRTHAFFGHVDHPWERLLDAGASVCIGTDGRSSNPDYSLWSELQFLAQQTETTRLPQILDAGTRQGARALGQENETGTITKGKRADLTVISLDEPTTTDPWTALFASTPRAITTFAAGSRIRTIRS
jgi:cytosine/adenosine deaminase-related metal-dependent hydrolase